MSDSNITRDGRQEMEILCYKVPALHMVWHSVIWWWAESHPKKFIINSCQNKTIITKWQKQDLTIYCL